VFVWQLQQRLLLDSESNTSSSTGSLSLIEEMEHEPILVDEFPISDDPASEGTQIPHELEAGGSRPPPPRSRGDLIPPEMIASATAQRELPLSFGLDCSNGL
jgi:hypothetical protein